MATISRKTEYPSSDGKPMAETDFHRAVMVDLIAELEDFYADDPMTYVSGDLLVFYERGNKRKHLAPDVFVARGVAKHTRDNYLIWEEGKGPDLVIEVTSKSTRMEDQGPKLAIYRDVMRVPEYVQFDPLREDPVPLQGFRLVEGEYRPIEPVDGRLPSLVTGLHFEDAGRELRLFSPALGRLLPNLRERIAEAEALARDERAARLLAEAETERLLREIEELRRQVRGGKAE
jgi:Uma2 family endonuclease